MSVPEHSAVRLEHSKWILSELGVSWRSQALLTRRSKSPNCLQPQPTQTNKQTNNKSKPKFTTITQLEVSIIMWSHLEICGKTNFTKKCECFHCPCPHNFVENFTECSQKTKFSKMWYLLPGNNKIEFSPETEIGFLDPTGDCGGEEEGKCGGEGVTVGREGGGREGGEVGEKDEGPRRT